MASTDAKAIPVKNAAMRVTFPLMDADGDLITGATGLDSEVSIDGGTFADCTNEATEIATASGMYYLDLTAAEMNGDTIAVIVKTSSSGAKTTPLVMYTAARNINDLAFPTVTGRSVDVTATGEVGIDWANVGAPTTALALTGTSVGTVTTLTGHTPQTGDGYARLGAPVGASVSADVAAVKSDSAAIKLKTDTLPADPADASDIAGSFGAVASALADILTDTGTTLDGKINAIKAVTDALPNAGALTAISSSLAAIKAKSDSLTFTVAGQVDANVQRINDVTITGNGQVGTEFGV